MSSHEIHLTLQDVLDSDTALLYLANKNLTQKIAYRLGKLHRKCLKEVKDYQKDRGEILRKYGAKPSMLNGEEILRVDEDSEDYDVCQKEMRDLFEEVKDEEAVLTHVLMVTLDELMNALPETPRTDPEDKDAKPIEKRIPSFVLTTLWWWITDEEEDKASGDKDRKGWGHETVMQRRKKAITEAGSKSK